MSEKTFKIVNGDMSDGYHTFDELYDHRCLLFINLCLAYPLRAYWKPHYEGWPLLVFELSSGQISYHVPEKFLPLFEGKVNRDDEYEWDGHTPADVVTRLHENARTK